MYIGLLPCELRGGYIAIPLIGAFVEIEDNKNSSSDYDTNYSLHENHTFQFPSLIKEKIRIPNESSHTSFRIKSKTNLAKLVQRAHSNELRHSSNTIAHNIEEFNKGKKIEDGSPIGAELCIVHSVAVATGSVFFVLALSSSSSISFFHS